MTNRLPNLVLIAAIAACQSPRSPAPSTSVSNTPAPHTSDTVPLAQGVEVYASTKGDLDGDGTAEPIEVRSNAMLRIGGLTHPLPFDHIEYPEEFARMVTVEVVALDGPHRAVVVSTPTEGIEDPPPHLRVFVVDAGAIAMILDEEFVGTDLRFPGDGTLRYDESADAACERAHYPQVPVGIDEVVYGRGAGGMFVSKGQHPSGRTFDCNNLSACPFVYVVGADGAHRVGEVLRNLRGAGAYALQSLELPEGATTIRISEEKSEVTFLDEIYVEIGGVRVEPRACSAAAPPAYCAADGEPYVMRQGDVLDLDVDATVDGPTAVFARGYYVPGEAGAGGPDT